jgi:hypothetical protein
MSRKVKSASWWVAALAAVGILGLGAREAFASGTANACQNDGWNYLGSQPSFTACWNACSALHPNLSQANWNSSTKCCSCLF